MRQLLLAALLGVCFTGTAFASGPDLSVDLSGPSQGMVGSPLSYSVALRNVGTQTAQSVVATVSIPNGLQVASTTTGCLVQANQVRCTYGSLPRGASTAIAVNLAAPSTAATVTLTASATTSSRDRNVPNNTDSQTTVIAPAAAPIVGQQDLHVVLCAGSEPFDVSECTPAAQQTLDLLLLPDFTIELPEPGYSGVYAQGNASLLQMTFTNLGDGLVEAVFDGVAISSTCFEGYIDYPQLPDWYGAFRACLVP